MYGLVHEVAAFNSLFTDDTPQAHCPRHNTVEGHQLRSLSQTEHGECECASEAELRIYRIFGDISGAIS